MFTRFVTSLRLRVCVASLAILFGVACGAGRNVEHSAPSEDLPHITWEVSAGKGEGDTDLVCSSQEPARACVLQASTPQTPRFATVSVDLHAAAQVVSYTGTVKTTFLAADRPHAVKQELEPGTEVKTVSIVDAVTSTPGAYTLEIELSGVMGKTEHPIKLSVPVAVH